MSLIWNEGVEATCKYLPCLPTTNGGHNKEL